MAIKFKRFIYIEEIGNSQIYSIISYDMKRSVSIQFFCKRAIYQKSMKKVFIHNIVISNFDK